MVKNTSQVFTKGRTYFRNSREIFALTVMGQEIYVVTDPAHIQAVFKQPAALDHDAMAIDILLDVGMTKETIHEICEPVYGRKTFIHTTHDNFRAQLHPGPQLDKVQREFLGHIDKSLQWNKITGSIGQSSPNNAKIVSLWEWCGEVLVDSAIEAFFDRSLYDFNPDILKDFFLFDDESWKLPYKLPRFAVKNLHGSMDRCIEAISQWLAIPAEKRDASWIINRMTEGMQQLGVTDARQRGAMVFIVFRLINTNAYRLCFWCLTYLLFDPELLNEVKEEMQPAWSADGNGNLDMNYLLERCPLLGSFYEEVLRLTVDTIGARVVKKRTKIGNHVLLPGRMVLMPFRQGHFDPDAFGLDASCFNPRRFLGAKNLSESPSWKPFGGGLAWCPGRFMARREVYMFLGVLLFRFDVSLYSRDNRTPRFPLLDETYPYGGILTPKKGERLLVEVRPLGG
ncbi:hypothetical protein HIM_05339 [Hirsutella minnesotensis 3608]|uniref:Cytochrome P450 n=1 Tax=Hirsutella minnesotensis 3608 TaxID=1043627 RepID=A0A0F7ZPA2_9HYPO|nr:hypothetical protein HIM_05339 [Hirsutella minnesotensis 3608]